MGARLGGSARSAKEVGEKQLIGISFGRGEPAFFAEIHDEALVGKEFIVKIELANTSSKSSANQH